MKMNMFIGHMCFTRIVWSIESTEEGPQHIRRDRGSLISAPYSRSHYEEHLKPPMVETYTMACAQCNTGLLVSAILYTGPG